LSMENLDELTSEEAKSKSQSDGPSEKSSSIDSIKPPARK
jgi:hypothetical protein